jgi:methyl-accepting chemotaxis protein
MNTKAIIVTVLTAAVAAGFCLAIGASLAASVVFVLMVTGISSINLVSGGSSISGSDEALAKLGELEQLIKGERNMITPLTIDNAGSSSHIKEKINSIIQTTLDSKDGDLKVYGEMMILLEKMMNGYIGQKVSQSSPNIEINYIAKTLNLTIENLLVKIGSDVNNISSVLDSYKNADFNPTIPNARGQVEVIVNGLGEEISTMLKKGLENGMALQQNAASLKDAVENLSTSSNQQAASLEETAAAMEEITGNVQSNAQKAERMARIAKEAGDATAHGTKLADSTFSAMNEIQKATASINESVAVIENIAFQTNILSLNAAVEAATAGEAGKGFAVVAQEVRNLANRSAEAAKTIKELARQAASKSNEGMVVAKNMNEGFITIADKIAETVETVDDVSVASKEQMQGISQINDAIAQLDQMTQANAQVSSQADSIANQTAFMAENLVKDANSKDFRGKESIRIPDFSSHAQASKPMIHTSPKISPMKKTTIAVAHKPVSKASSNDVWESF